MIICRRRHLACIDYITSPRPVFSCCAGTVTNVKEACAWLSYTYLFVRMLKNPLAYGVPWEEIASDPRLEGHRKTLITTAARQLEK